jgi:hypothetical protein
MIDYGVHLTMYPTEKMRLADYQKKYDEVFAEICQFKAAAKPQELPYALYPSERKMVMISSALAQAAECSTNPNTSFMCWAFHQHLSAVNMTYDELLAQGVTPLLALIGSAMEQAASPSNFLYQNEGNAVKEDLGRMLGYVPGFFDDGDSDGSG